MSGENDQMIGMIVLKYLIINFIEAKSSNRVPTELLPPAAFAVGSNQTLSNCSVAFFTKSLLLLRTPASKLRVFSPFIPSPAPVRLAEPTYAVFKSKTMILK